MYGKSIRKKNTFSTGWRCFLVTGLRCKTLVRNRFAGQTAMMPNIELTHRMSCFRLAWQLFLVEAQHSHVTLGASQLTIRSNQNLDCGQKILNNSLLLLHLQCDLWPNVASHCLTFCTECWKLLRDKLNCQSTGSGCFFFLVIFFCTETLDLCIVSCRLFFPAHAATCFDSLLTAPTLFALCICPRKCCDLLILCFQSWGYRGGDRRWQVIIWLPGHFGFLFYYSQWCHIQLNWNKEQKLLNEYKCKSAQMPFFFIKTFLIFRKLSLSINNLPV